MTLQQFLLILRARAKIIFFTLLATVLVTLLVSLLLPKQYTASTAIVIDVKSPDPVAGMVLPAMVAPGYMSTQVDIINSDRVAQSVVRLLHMDQSPVIQEQWTEATEGKGDITTWLAGLLKKELDVKPSRDSNVINIEFSGADPGFVATVANAFAQAYINVNLELKIEPARQYATWFENQTRLAREKLEKAQQTLSDYQQKTGIVATDERLDHETNKLNELSTQLTLIQTQTSDSSSKQKSGGNAATLTEVIQNPLINGLKSDIAHLEAKLQESNINLGKNHPQTQRTESELASLRNRLSSETRQISNSIGTSYQVGKQKEKELLDALARQKNRVLELNKQRDSISVLQRDVEAAQRTYEGISQRSAQTRLESMSAQTNIAVLNPATEPAEHSRPRIMLNLLISVFLGVLLGTGVALLLEISNRRIRSAEDLIEAIDLPVLTVISSAPSSETGLQALRGRILDRLPKRSLPALSAGNQTGI